MDEPRTGEASSSTESADSSLLAGVPRYNDRTLFTLFRLGEWPNYYPGVQFPKDRKSLNQFIRQSVVPVGTHDPNVTTDAVIALLDSIGPSILVTHSVNGTVGWRTALHSDNLKAIVAFEPGGGGQGPFLFPTGEVPESIPTYWGAITPMEVTPEEFDRLTKIPIIIYYGDNIAVRPEKDAGRDQWRGELQMARKFAEIINKHGGKCKVIHLPEIGIKGNTHFPFSDMNNVEVANLMDKFLSENVLNR